MIYNYEAEILKFINQCYSKITLATYANDEDMLLSMSDVKTYPSFIYQRLDSEWTNNKILEVAGPTKVVQFCPFTQTYKGIILVESQLDAIRLSKNLRFQWASQPFVNIDWAEGYDKLKVQLRLLYIKIGEQRNPANKKGACRFVEFSWQSQLFLTPETEAMRDSVLVEEVRVYLDEGEGKVIGTDSEGKEIILNNLIQVANG